MTILLILVLQLGFLAGAQANDSDRLVQLIDYIGVDYSAAVSEGVIVNQLEYDEMMEFAGIIETEVQKMVVPSDVQSLRQQATALKDLILSRASPLDVKALTQSMRATVVQVTGLKVTPDRIPDISRGKLLYQSECAACHGPSGSGKGNLAEGLDPQPTDFTDQVRYSQRSLYALFNTITNGVDGTGMAAYPHLSADDRWSLAAYVGSLGAKPNAASNGQRLWQQADSAVPIDIQGYASLSPEEAAEKLSGGADVMAFLRTDPIALFDRKDAPLDVAMSLLQSGLESYQQGETEKAYTLTLTAYLEGFELAESTLSAVDGDLMRKIEAEMMQLRSAIRAEEPVDDITARVQAILSLLQQAKTALSDSEGLSTSAAFITSLVILLREGLEALLVVVAISAFLIKTGRREAMPYLHSGWIAALLLGGLTWVVSEHFIQISGATREVTEGVAALLASGMLLFVGYWLHSKTSAAGWHAFIQKSLQTVLARRTLWGLTGLTFISVYREVFETILFYQALWTQATGDSANWIMAGFGAGTLILAVVAWLVIRFSVKLPLRQFFATTGILLLALSFIFAGKGIAALQEAGTMPQTLLQFTPIEWLGIYPSREGLLLQTAILISSLVFLSKSFSRKTGQ
ncbi:FTR1 family protein [Kordiimonas lipolytica]|uniref:FTR1 family protein n=1 Tax=Kordiimonas lipolytica TaxID=1662421 RepID=A0ABV8U5Z6_9PROT|nr:cytochrome c/FTR1 family iron permease [Kordiimonas lipolytica]